MNDIWECVKKLKDNVAPPFSPATLEYDRRLEPTELFDGNAMNGFDDVLWRVSYNDLYWDHEKMLTKLRAELFCTSSE